MLPLISLSIHALFFHSPVHLHRIFHFCNSFSTDSFYLVFLTCSRGWLVFLFSTSSEDSACQLRRLFLSPHSGMACRPLVRSSLGACLQTQILVHQSTTFPSSLALLQFKKSDNCGSISSNHHPRFGSRLSTVL